MSNWKNKEEELRNECIKFITSELHKNDKKEYVPSFYCEKCYLDDDIVERVFLDVLNDNVLTVETHYADFPVEDITTNELLDIAKSIESSFDVSTMSNAEKAKKIINSVTSYSISSTELTLQVIEEMPYEGIMVTLDLDKIPMDVLEEIIVELKEK